MQIEFLTMLINMVYKESHTNCYNDFALDDKIHFIWCLAGMVNFKQSVSSWSFDLKIREMFYLWCSFLKCRAKLEAAFCQPKFERTPLLICNSRTCLCWPFCLSVSVTGGAALARTVENKASSLVPPSKQGVISTERQKVLGWSPKKEKHHDLIVENLHSVNSDVCQEPGSKRGAKLAHVTDVMRERFEDDCLLSAASRADNQELE